MGMVLGYALVAAGATAMLALHLVGGLDPLTATISQYFYAPDGWLLPLSLTSIAVGSAVLAVRLDRLGRLDRRAALLVGMWSACLLLVAGFPTDPLGAPLSLSGNIHRYAAFVAFASLPVAGLRVARATQSRLVRVLCAVALGSLVLVVVPYVFRVLSLDPGAVPAGLTQRLTVVTEMAALVAMSVSASLSAPVSAPVPAPVSAPVSAPVPARRSAAAALVGVDAGPDLVSVADAGRARPGVDRQDGHHVAGALVVGDVDRHLVLAGPVDRVGRGVPRQGDAHGARRLVGPDVVEAQRGLLAAAGDEGDRAAVGGQRPRAVVGHDLGWDRAGQLGAREVVDGQPGGVGAGVPLQEDGRAVPAEAGEPARLRNRAGRGRPRDVEQAAVRRAVVVGVDEGEAVAVLGHVQPDRVHADAAR
ncbi:DUF998 domain-containing protein [Microbispora hainanensis]|uniref:DUF998 domain-containing protein n=1 Tax=Microbispora hainanensis TaxID=568844 RepID=A0A544YPQ8_9ACTN|nr:DUF998 domain-containing protein [Microbispora hainanensis]